MQPKNSDPVIDEIREIRHQISARCEHDPVKLIAYYLKLQEQYRDRLLESEQSARADHSIVQSGAVAPHQSADLAKPQAH